MAQVRARSYDAQWLRITVVLCAVCILPLTTHAQDTKDLSPRLADAIAKSGRKTVAVVRFHRLTGVCDGVRKVSSGAVVA